MTCSLDGATGACGCNVHDPSCPHREPIELTRTEPDGSSKRWSVPGMTFLETVLKGLHPDFVGITAPEEKPGGYEFRLIIPVEHCSKNIRQSIAEEFGGYTVTRGEGAWFDSHGKLVEEDVMIFVVATREKQADIIRIAHRLREETEQECLYLRLTDGEVVYVY